MWTCPADHLLGQPLLKSAAQIGLMKTALDRQAQKPEALTRRAAATEIDA